MNVCICHEFQCCCDSLHVLHFCVKIHKFLMLNIQIEPKMATLIIIYWNTLHVSDIIYSNLLTKAYSMTSHTHHVMLT